METVFIKELKPFLESVAGEMELYVPKKSGEHYVYTRYDGSGEVEINNIRTCATVKEFLFPACELAATFPEPTEAAEIKPFAVFGLKDCDLCSIEVLDMVFANDDYKDELYLARREKMLIISSDCIDPAQSCFCNIFDGRPYAQSGFDLNVSKLKEGFVIEAGSQKGQKFIEAHKSLFTAASEAQLSERDQIRTDTQSKLEQINAEYKLDAPVREIVEACQDSDVFDESASGCVECQGCTRICPTCHCFYLYDTKQKDYSRKIAPPINC